MTDLSSVWAGPFDLPPLGDISDLPTRQTDWRRAFERHLFGPMPVPPSSVTIRREPLDANAAERLVISVSTAHQEFTVDAALWLPEDRGAPSPLICGLDFTGPAGVMTTDDFPLDRNARVYSRPTYGATEGRLEEVLRGTAAYRWPIETMLKRGYAVIVSCYGSWTPDDALLWRSHGIANCTGDTESGAISCWAWALSRLIDAAGLLPEVDAAGVAVAGHSRLGKAALWAAAWDARIGAVLANNSGCAGAAPVRHARGETLEQMAARFPHWLRPDAKPDLPPIDQHQLIALAAPRAVYVASAEDDAWADPIGSYEALRIASAAWGDAPESWASAEEMWSGCRQQIHGKLGHHIRPGGHDLLPYDWRRFLDFIDGLP